MRFGTMVPRLEMDGVGLALSGLCLVHCLAPVLLPTVLSTSAFHSVSDPTHAILAIVLPAVALFAFQRGYAVHRSATPAAWGTTGVALVVAGAVLGHSLGEDVELVLSVVGSLLLAGAHLANQRMLRGDARRYR